MHLAAPNSDGRKQRLTATVPSKCLLSASPHYWQLLVVIRWLFTIMGAVYSYGAQWTTHYHQLSTTPNLFNVTLSSTFTAQRTTHLRPATYYAGCCFGLSPFWTVDILARPFLSPSGCRRFDLSPLWLVAVLTIDQSSYVHIYTL